VTIDEMLHRIRAVRRAVRRALVVADLPFGTYHVPVAEGLRIAIRFIKEAGADAIKIGGLRTELTRVLTKAEIPVVGHLGLTPQGLHRAGDFRAQRRNAESASQLKADAHAVFDAAACAIVLEGVPREVSAAITAELAVPTIGIGAGPDCDGQIQVLRDLVNPTFGHRHRFVRRNGDAAVNISTAAENFRADVEQRGFPSDDESYHLPEASAVNRCEHRITGGDT
jgi:3-methyl-2-oxobutanoate hydroxymethyltransferase